MRGLLAKLVNGEISRRDFTNRLFGMGFGMMTVESILDTVAVGQGKRRGNAKKSEAFRAEPFREKTPYEQWMQGEDIPVHTGFFVSDVRAAELKPWKRLGAKGALIDLEGAEATDGAYLCEIAAGASTNPQRYMFEESIYVLDGEGETTVWHENRPKQTFKWKKGTLFSPPLNTWRVHKNLSPSPARFISITDLPLIMDLYHNADFIFNNDFVFRDRYDNQPDYFTVNQSKMKIAGSAATFGEGEKGAVGVLDTGLIPDLNEIQLFAAKARGLKNKSAEVVLSDNSMQTHVSEFEVGTYKRAHRHGPGSHVLAMGGMGYSLMWTTAPRYSEAPKKVRVDWKDGTLFVPPDRWFHQHFNTGDNSAKYMATTWIGGKYFVKGMGGGGRTHRLNTVSFHHGGNMIDYTEEDPVVREMFEAELRKHGVDLRMPDRKS
ncbi:MAG: ethanolamine ammonia lyase-activating protein [Acidobacteriota bacterium]|nr:ethanolamine ammonia lyase-activating protein [Acidobacteriota bacterium]